MANGSRVHLTEGERHLLDTWTEYGVPENVSTQDKRDELVVRLWATVQANEARIEELLKFVIQKCTMCGRVTEPLEQVGVARFVDGCLPVLRHSPVKGSDVQDWHPVYAGKRGGSDDE